jgi:hypothetical protein
MGTVEHGGQKWWDNGVSSHGKDRANALKFATWMRKGGFRTAIVKRPDGYHVLTRTADEP